MLHTNLIITRQRSVCPFHIEKKPIVFWSKSMALFLYKRGSERYKSKKQKIS